MQKISLDTNILIDNPEIVFRKNVKFVVSFKVVQELDGLKRNPNLKFAAQTALRNIEAQISIGKIEVLNLPDAIGDSPDEIIINDTKNANALLLSGDLGARLIAQAFGVGIAKFEPETTVDPNYTGIITVQGDLEYEHNMVQIKEIPLQEFNTIMNVNLLKNQYCIVDRMVEKDDIWWNHAETVTRISQSSKPFKDAGIVDTPLDSEQQCALHSVFVSDVPLTIVDGKVGTGKTILSLMGALANTRGQKRYRHYDKVIVTKPPISIDKNLYTGYKPGPQPLHAKILTPDGWSTMGEMRIGSIVMGRDGKPAKVTGVYPKGKKEVFRIRTTTGKETLACSDHLWVTQNHNEFKHNKPGVVRTTAEIANTLEYKSSGKLNHHLPRREPMQFGATKEMLLDPYVLGCLLGNGSIGIKGAPTITSVDIEMIQEIDSRLRKINAKVLGCSDINYILGASDNQANKPTGPNSYRKFTNPVKIALNDLGILGHHFDTKYIPDTYLYDTSVEDRLDLLRGLMDTDGTVNRDGKAVFYTSGTPLMNSVIELVMSLGGSTSIYTRDRTNNINTIPGKHEIKATYEFHEISITLPKDMIPFLLSRKKDLFIDRRIGRCISNVTTDVISEITPHSYEEVQCISVDNTDHLYITDNYIVTHNTSEEKLSGHLGGIISNLKFLLEKNDKDKKAEIANDVWDESFDIIEIDEIQGVSLHRTILLVDEYQLLSNDVLKLVITRIAEGSKLVLIGDTKGQTYGVNRANEGFKRLYKFLGSSDLMSYIRLTKIYRSALAEFMSEVYDD